MTLRWCVWLVALGLLAVPLVQGADPADPKKNPFETKDEFGKKVRDLGRDIPQSPLNKTPTAKVDVREYNRPLELVLDTGGRTGPCDVLAFSPDGKTLYAAGDDKVVRLWPFDPGTGRLDQANARSLRWANFLQQRGSIYAAAVDDKWERMAVAGWGLRNGSVALIDLRRDKDNPAGDREGTILAGLTSRNCPTGHKRYDNPKDQFDKTIWSLALSPDGKQVALGNEHGRVWVWEPAQQDSLRPLGTLPDRAPELNRPTLIRFLRYSNATTVLAVGANGHVVEFDTTQTEAAPRKLFRFAIQDIRNVAYDKAQKRFAVIPAVPRGSTDVIEIRKEDGSGARTLSLPPDHFPQSVAFDPSGKRLAVGYYKTPLTARFNKYTGAGIRLFNLEADDTTGKEGPANSYLPEVLTFDPSGTYLAVAGGDDQEVTVHDLGSGKETSRVTGVGQGLWGVAFSSDAKSEFIAFRADRSADPGHPNAWGAGEWKVFNRLEMRWAEAKEAAAFKPFEPLTTYDGWEVITDPKKSSLDKASQPNAYHWTVAGPGKVEYPLSWTEDDPLGRIDRDTKTPLKLARGLIPNEDGKPRCYTFVPPRGDGPVRLVIGHYWGMSVFELRKDQKPVLTRRLIGHQGEVMSVAPSADGKFLISASRDQTVACWSLEPFPSHPALGASFKLDDQKVMRVDKVDPGSPAWEAGLVSGDELLDLAEGALVPPARWLERLKAAQPGQSLTFYLRRVGSAVGVATVCSMKQRPLFVFFPQRGDEWVAWRYYGYTYDCSTNGDFAIGWQLNRDVDGTPRFDRAEQYRKKFHNPKAMKDFQANLLLPPDNTNVLDYRAPDARVSPETGVVGSGDDKVRIVFTAQAIGELEAHKVTSIEVWVNDHIRHRQELDNPRTAFTEDIYLPRSALRQGRNVVTLHAFTREEVRGQHTAEIVVRAATSPQPDLYVLSVGVSAYEDSTNLPPLNAGRDAEGVARLWQKQEGQVFRKVHKPVTLLDKQATRTAILDYLDQLAANPKLRADDVLVVFLAGHGTSKSELERALSGDDSGKRGPRNIKLTEDLDRDTFVFCTYDIDLRKPKSSGVTGRDLYEKLRALPCRKVVLLDTCHSGTVGRDPIREMVPSAVGPVILSACAYNQQAAEDGRLGRIRAEGQATGLFSIALIQAMNRRFKEADSVRVDNLLDAEELGEFVRQAVPSLLREITGKEPPPDLKATKRDTGDWDSDGQIPAYFIPELETRLVLARSLKK